MHRLKKRRSEASSLLNTSQRKLDESKLSSTLQSVKSNTGGNLEPKSRMKARREMRNVDAGLLLVWKGQPSTDVLKEES